MLKKTIILWLPASGLILSVVGLPYILLAQEKPSPQQVRRERAEWFYHQRAYPNSEIPAGARLKALDQLEQMISNSAANDVVANDDTDLPPAGADWALIGPSPTNEVVDPKAANKSPFASGRVTSLAVTAADANVVYLGAAEGGVWKSTDGGQNWDPISDTQKSLAIGSIAIDPNKADLVYVGTGEGNFSDENYYGAGVLRWDNSKKTWSLTSAPFVGPFGPRSQNGGAYIGAIAVSPADGKILLAGVNFKLPGGSRKFSGVYRSDDSGQTWKRVLPTGPDDPFCKKSEYNNDQCGAPGTAVVFDPTDGMIAYAALGDPINLNDLSAVYKSADGGSTWALSQGGDLEFIIKGRISLDISRPDKQKPATLLAGVSDTGGDEHRSHGVYVSRDNGQTWKTIPSGNLPKLPDYCNPECQYANVVRINPKNVNQFFVGGTDQGATHQTLYRSLDGGQNWTDVSVSAGADVPVVRLHVDQHALAFDSGGTRLYIGNDGGSWRSLKPDAKEISYDNLNNAGKKTLAIAQFYPGISIDPDDVDKGLGGTQDNGTQRYSGKPEWEQVTCGDGGYTAIDFSNTKTVYTGCQKIDVRKSTMSGDRDSWSTISDGDGGITGSSLFIAPLVLDTKDPGILYFGADSLWRAMGGDRPWKKLLFTNSKISTIAVAPNNSKTVLLATETGSVYAAVDADQQAPKFVNVTKAPLPNRFPTEVAIDPTDSTVAYLVFSGFEQNKVGASSRHVFRAKLANKLADTTWTDISGDLPDIPVNDMVVDPSASENRLYVASDIGVFATSNAGKSWAPMQPNSLPRVAVLGLRLHQPTRTLRAATHGRSMWELRVPEPKPDIKDLSPMAAVAQQKGFQLEVHGNYFSPNAVVTWNGSRRETHFVSNHELRVPVYPEDLVDSGSIAIAVENPEADGIVSDAVNFQIRAHR